LKPCKSNQIRNPKTVRCVKKSGKIGQLLLGATESAISEPVIPGPGLPTKFKKIAEDCAQNNVWKQKKILGQGKYGSVYEACRVGNCDYVLKTQKDDQDFRIEVKALEDLQRTKIVPKLYAAWTCNGRGYLVIEKLNKCRLSGEELYEGVKSALTKIREAGWLHVDTHYGNIMCAKGKKVVIVDFGWAVKRGPGGDNQMYPDHPLAGPEKYGKPVSWYFLEAAQWYNFNFDFNQGKTTAQQEEFMQAYENYKEAEKKIIG
jgi:predicted Ser/Thr protein kinase